MKGDKRKGNERLLQEREGKDRNRRVTGKEKRREKADKEVTGRKNGRERKENCWKLMVRKGREGSKGEEMKGREAESNWKGKEKKRDG